MKEKLTRKSGAVLRHWAWAPDMPRSLPNGSAEADVVPDCLLCANTLTTSSTNSARSLQIMSGQDAFRRFAQQVQRAGGSGGRVPPGGGALVAGAIALIGGGALLNASLFNGE